jgi:SAM-dependent methyltransferase
VLDLGCGDGKNLAWFTTNDFVVRGVDASRSAIAKCELYLKAKGVAREKYKLCLSDVRDLRKELNDDSVSTAICIDVLGHQGDPQKTLAELHRLLIPRGVACVSLFDLADEVRAIPGKSDATDRSRMVEIEPRGREEYYYYPDYNGEPSRRYYFRFYSQDQAVELLEKAHFRVLEKESVQWTEPAHPGYRHSQHKHSSWFLMVEKPQKRE